MHPKRDFSGWARPTTGFMPSGLGERPTLEAETPVEHRRLVLAEGAAIAALAVALALELGLALGLY